MNLEQLIKQFELVTDTKEGLQQLRKVILNQAVRGKLIKHDTNNETAEKLLERIRFEKQRLYKEGEIRKPKALDPVLVDEKSFELPKTWKWSKIGNAYYIEMGQSPPSKYYNSEGEGLPFYQGKTEFGELYPEPEKWCSNPNKISYKGDVLISVRAPVGPTNICLEKSCIGRGLAAIRPLCGVSSMYTLYCIRSFEDKLSGQGSGSTFKAITKKDLLNFILPIPPKEVQQRIVQKIETLFSQVDKLEQKVEQDRQVDERLQVAVLDDLQRAETPEASKRSWQRLTDHFEQIYRKPEHIDQLKQAILNEAVRGRLVPQDPNDEPAEKLLERIKEEKQRLYEEGEIRKPSDLPEISEEEIPYELPDGWAWCRFGSVIELISGQHIKSDKYSENGVGTPYLTGPSDFGERYPQITKWTEHPKAIAQKDDILLTVKGSGLGKINQVDINEICISRQLMAIRPIKLNTEYIYKFLISRFELFQSLAVGIAIPGINRGDVNNELLALPPLEEQGRIGEKIRKLFTWCDDFKEKLIRSLQTDQRLLEALVNGSFNLQESDRKA